MRVVAEIEIPAEDKAALRDELDRLFGVSQLTLFPDVHGFASANSQSSAISRLFDPDYYTDQGGELYQRGEFRRSIFAFDESIRLRPDLWMTHYLRGNAKAQNGDYNEAKNDYGTALILLNSSAVSTQTARSHVESQTALVFFNRGNMQYVLGRYEDACVDYSEAIGLCNDAQQGPLRYNRANAKTKVGQFEAALDDYEFAIRLDVGHAVFNKGNALVGLGRFAEALHCYSEESKKYGSQKTENNIAIMHEVISRIEDPSRIVCTFDPADKMVGGLPTVTVFRDEREVVKKNTIGPATGTTFLCTGSAGNVGNYGGGGTEGGEGFDGDNGFGLRITW